MIDQVLTLIVCVIPFILLTALAAILGSQYRARLANKIIVGMREGRFKDFSNPKTAIKLRLFLLLALFSIIGLIFILILITRGMIISSSKLTIGFYIFFILTGAISGIRLFMEVVDRLKG